MFRDEISEGNFNNFCHFRCSVPCFGLYVKRTRGQKLSRHLGKISFDQQVMYKVSWICDDMKRDQCRRSRTKEARNCSLFREAAISMLARWGPELMNFVRGGAILRTIPRCLRSPHVSDRLM